MDYSPIILSLQVASASTLLSLPFGLACSFLLARWNSRFKPALDALINIPLVLPPLCTGYLLLLIFGKMSALGRILQALGWSVPFTPAAAVLAAAAVSFPLMVRAMRVSFESVDSRLEDSARTLGASDFDVFLSVTLPLSRSGVAAGCVLAFARGLGEFGATIIFAGNIAGRTRTMPLAMFDYFNSPGGQRELNFLMIISVALCVAAMLAANRLMQGEWRGVRGRGEHDFV